MLHRYNSIHSVIHEEAVGEEQEEEQEEEEEEEGDSNDCKLVSSPPLLPDMRGE